MYKHVMRISLRAIVRSIDIIGLISLFFRLQNVLPGTSSPFVAFELGVTLENLVSFKNKALLDGDELRDLSIGTPIA